MKTLRLLHVANRCYPYIGGTENYVYNLAKEQARQGHDVTILCAREPLLNSGISESVAIKRLPYLFKIANTNITSFLPFEILKQNFDIIHTQMPHPWSADWAAIISCIKRKPLVLTYQNDIPEKGHYGLLMWIYNRTFLRIILSVSKVIIISHQGYLESSRFLTKFKDKIRAIPCGVDTEKFFPLNTEKKNIKKIFFLSVLDEYHRYKGLDYLLRAFVRIQEKIANTRLVIGGDGTLRKEYERMAQELGIATKVDFIGRIPENKMNFYFNDCDVFVLPSISSEQEGFGIVVLEAMACKKPVVVTSIVGVAREIQESLAGKVVSPKDEEALIRSLLELVKNTDDALRFGENGRKVVESNFSWKIIAQRIVKMYESVQCA